MKKLLLLAVLSIMLSSAVSPNSKVINWEQQSCKLKIGDTHAGGIVFYLDHGGECHGLVCAQYDQAPKIGWADAVTLCKSLRLGNYSDWRLPSEHELNQMYTNLHKAGLGGFASSNYWSSTEAFSDVVWGENFRSGTQFNEYKYGTHHVRAVRGF